MRIRPYEKRDAKDLTALIRALAKYEKRTPPSPAAAKRLIADIGKRIWVMMAAVDGKSVGYAIYLFTYKQLSRPSDALSWRTSSSCPSTAAVASARGFSRRCTGRRSGRSAAGWNGSRSTGTPRPITSTARSAPSRSTTWVTYRMTLGG